MRSESIHYEPALVEEVVRHEIDGRAADDELRVRYRQALDETYRYGGAERLAAAQRVHEAMFADLGWPVFFQAQLADLLPRVSAAGVARVDGQEGCFVDARCRLQIRLRAARLRDREPLRRYLRHELAHVSDILDPAFGYREEPVDEPTRLRYAALWCASIDARLKGDALEPVTHAGLLQRARDQSRPKCPLCALPTVRWGSPSPQTVERIRKEYPSWSPQHGVCDRCLEWAEMTADTLGNSQPPTPKSQVTAVQRGSVGSLESGVGISVHKHG